MISTPKDRRVEVGTGGAWTEEQYSQRKTRVLIANEPRSYREVIGAALQALKPDVEVLVIKPEELDREVQRRATDLALCSRLTPTVEREVPVWVELYPDEEPSVMMSIDGLRLAAVDDIGLHNLLWIVERAEVLAQKR